MKAEVVVVGGGPAGMTAAIAAARNGADTILMERESCLGGVATSGLLCVWGPFVDDDPCWDYDNSRLISEKMICRKRCVNGNKIIGGIADEILNKLVRLEGAECFGSGFIPLNPETLKFVAEQTCLEAGVRILYSTQIVGARVVNGSVKDLSVVNKQGITEIAGDVFVDATGDGDLAFYAGAPWEKGRKKDGKMQAVTMVFRLGGVMTGAKRIMKSNDERQKADEIFLLEYKRGNVSDKYGVGCITVVPGMQGVVSVNSQGTFDVDGTSAEDVTRATIRGRECVREMAALFKKYLKGFENCYLLDTAPVLGVRETRRILGEYVLTKEDILGAKKFPDHIGKNSYGLDIHLPTSKKVKLSDILLKPGAYYDIPYRCLLPKKVNNLLVSGRCISSTHEAQSSIRIMPCCMVTGQAAGTAAALCLKRGTIPNALSVKELQDVLTKDGAYVK